MAGWSNAQETEWNPVKKMRHKGVFLLPNALTTGALFAGFYSIISGINGHYTAAAVAVVIAGVLDGLDGRVARLTNTQSEFGVQYDSLSDLISFGLAPGMATSTSIIGTLICGSSSLGSRVMARKPRRREATMPSGVNFELINARARPPAKPGVLFEDNFICSLL